jgi:hypothetical protein
MKTVLTIALIAMLLLATGTAHADAIDVCKQRFRAGELQPGDEIGACYAKATKNRCDGSLDGADAQAKAELMDFSPSGEYEASIDRRGALGKAGDRLDPPPLIRHDRWWLQ